MQYISKYGYKYIIIFAFLMFVFLAIDMFECFFVTVFIACVAFFRQRESVKCTDKSQILVPIDGKISHIGIAEFEGQSCTKVEIDKSIFGVGVLYAVCLAKTVVLKKRHGLFLCTKMKQSNALNQRALYIFEDKGFKIYMRVIAGALSRSLELEDKPEVSPGDILGFLGSGKVVLFLPKDIKICVSIGERVRSQSTLGYLETRSMNA
ncbi:phosphatidylserine decarboxylase [Campylobacter sp. RM9344]|uniref:Phosphatidylserine decarboxylase n=1 Tax=Campylobacter californiensis TaxID=1032243 RepID=A0AAW3ZUU4_9BACT|nr:phosphatidylserine decarboxylase [Campylobacter sp. RM9337]MBE3029727.1 phosphatidylserine decarboxylase [Campylobacter sp. RM9344]MBE3608657.1 phosphatidylserine decarboxylase [Campylobacter sp. RM9337]